MSKVFREVDVGAQRRHGREGSLEISQQMLPFGAGQCMLPRLRNSIFKQVLK